MSIKTELIDINNQEENKDNIKKKKNYNKIKEKNIIDESCSIINPIIKKTIGVYYYIIHLVIILFGASILVFSNNIWYLLILINIVSIDCLAIIAFQKCPLTILEKKYLNTKLNLNYFFNNELYVYEKQLEFVIGIWSLLVIKIFTLIIMKSLKYNFN